MRYQNLKAFQKHLQSAAPHNLCRMYLIAISDDFERAKAIDAILSYISATAIRLSGADCSVKDILDAAGTLSLLGDSVVVVDEAEKIAKKQAQILCDEMGQPAGYLILGARSKTPLSILVEKEGVVLDMLEEKSWDKEKRLAEFLIERAQKGGKKATLDVATLLIERLGADAACLENEMDKLICYVAERTTITTEDVLTISPANKSSTLWQIAEEIIWEQALVPPVDVAAFHTLTAALRSQLHLGLTLATLIEEQCPSDQWSRYLPKIWPKTLEKRSSAAARLGSAFFQNGLKRMFDLELQSRSNSTQHQALLDHFRAGLYVR